MIGRMLAFVYMELGAAMSDREDKNWEVINEKRKGRKEKKNDATEMELQKPQQTLKNLEYIQCMDINTES